MVCVKLAWWSPALLWTTLALTPAVVGAEQLTLTPSKDTTLSEDDFNYSNGAGPSVFIGTTAGGRRRALLKFDLSVLPVSAQITSAQLRFFIDRNGIGSGADSAILHRMLAAWDEGTSFATGGTGTQATEMDATWQYRVYGNPPTIPRIEWTNLGSDFALSASAAISILSLGAYTFATTPALVADVQSWVVAPANNHGWAFLGPEDGRSQTARRILSRESSDVANRPTLTIDYTVPPVTIQAVPLPTWASWVLGVFICARGGRLLDARTARV